ncbi:YbaB/EbfC family nucleoid-associated protein [Plantactinospora solaniradicis]|uniref:YbaB/EbfC family nucleoid-associated protein n=1 Tax=Plantactinospora solaniradicis TaxID=1723736 RepID=A0ABW1KLK5_9ACTN
MDISAGELSGRLAEYSRLTDDVLAMRDGIDKIRVTAESPDGLVAATVGGRGELRDLELDPRIYREPDAAALARTIVGTIRDAAGAAAQDAARIAARLIRAEADERADPLVDPVLHLLETEPERSQRLWRG